MTDKLAIASSLAALSDHDLADETARAAAVLAPHVETFAFELAAGIRPQEAARRAGLSDKGGGCYEVAKRPEVVRLVLALREGARRRAAVTTVSQIGRLQALSVKAENRGELSTAVAAEKEIDKVAGFHVQDVRVAVAPSLDITINTGGWGPGSMVACTSVRDGDRVENVAGRPVIVAGAEPKSLTPASRAVVDVSRVAAKERTVEEMLS